MVFDKNELGNKNMKRNSRLSESTKEGSIIQEEAENDLLLSSDDSDSNKDDTEVRLTMGSHGQTEALQSTPKIEKDLVTRSSELIKEFGPSSMEYSYYVIASPVVGRKVSSSANTSMTSRSYSFVSMSSKDSSSSEVSAVLQPTKRAPKSRGLLQSVKEKLLAEIENINIELIKMDSEKLVLVNLRNASLLYRDMICKSERNNQGIPNTSKLRTTCESIELKVQDEEHALQDDLSIPNIEVIRKDLKGVVDICKNIAISKTSIKMTTVEELLSAVGKLYGAVDMILAIFYDDINETKDTTDSSCDVEDVMSPIPSPTADVNEESMVRVDLNESKSSDEDHSFIEQKNGRNMSFTSPQEKTTPLEISHKLEQHLKTLQKRLIRAKRLFRGIERLSSGNPKPKSLSICFKEINSMLTDELLRELSLPELWCQVIKQKVVDLQKHLVAERPGERELEHIRIIVGELSGRIGVVVKSHMLE